MMEQYHILNGDALRERFPTSIPGEIIVARECLVDGEVDGENLQQLFANRARFISQNYEGYSAQDYFRETVPEFRKIQNIPPGTDITLWFEDDLFCQVNFWFIVHLLSQGRQEKSAYLVRPPVHNQYGFGRLNEAALANAFDNRQHLLETEKLSRLWPLYQKNEIDGLFQLAESLTEIYPFILPAVRAHVERLPAKGDPGRPKRVLRRIMEELQTEEFDPVFQAFNKRESIYGFGGLQVRRLLKEVINS